MIRTLLPFLLVAALTASRAHAADVTPVSLQPSALPEIGEETSLAALTSPERFAWPARFTCRFGGTARSLSVTGASYAELNDKLAAIDLYLEDCRGGFVLQSLEPQDGKLEQIVGDAADGGN